MFLSEDTGFESALREARHLLHELPRTRDAIVEDAVLVELKAARALGPPHEAQLLNYLKATNLTVGLIFNFGPRPKFLRRVVEDRRAKHYHGRRG